MAGGSLKGERCTRRAVSRTNQFPWNHRGTRTSADETTGLHIEQVYESSSCLQGHALKTPFETVNLQFAVIEWEILVSTGKEHGNYLDG
jgi:hypothetical protein